MGDKMACIRGKPGLQSGNKKRVLATLYGNGSNQDSSVRGSRSHLVTSFPDHMGGEKVAWE